MGLMKELFMQERHRSNERDLEQAYADHLYVQGLRASARWTILTNRDPGDEHEPKPRNAHKQQPPKGTN